MPRHIKTKIGEARFPFLILLFFIVFNNWSVTFLTDLFIIPILSTISESNTLIDLVISGLTIYTLWYLIKSGLKGVRISPTTTYWIILSGIVYLHFRIILQGEYTYVKFKTWKLNMFALSDVIFLFILALPFYYIIYRYSKKKAAAKLKSQETVKFFFDEPIELTPENDIYERWHHLKDILKIINSPGNPDKSFAIAIQGKWGTGKTSFINGLKNELLKADNVIYFEFNPWLVKDAAGITISFFNSLSSHLSEYDFQLRNKILSYSKQLIANSDSTLLKVFKSILNLDSDENVDLQKQQLNINERIKEMQKKVVITIDDVDRLHEDEAIEVLKIVRNSANFGHTYFLVAFQRDYLLSAIRNQRPGIVDNYLEKIFQIEYNLPLKNIAEKIDQIFNDRIKEILTPTDTSLLDQMQALHRDLAYYEIMPVLAKYCETLRDVGRLLNVISVHYENVKNNIYLPDFLYICILKLKYPEVYKVLYTDRFKFLTTGRETENLFPIIDAGSNNTLFVKSDPDKDPSPVGSTAIFKCLSKAPGLYSVPESEIQTVTEMICILFNNKKNGSYHLQEKRTLTNNQLSIQYWECFDRYFEFSLIGHILEEDLNHLFTQDMQTIKNGITKWNTDRVSRTELRIKLENIFAFNNAEYFEKVISAIVFFADLEDKEKNRFLGRNGYNSFLSDNFLKKLDLFYSNGMKVVNELYSADIAGYRSFLKDLFSYPTYPDHFTFIYQIGKDLMRTKSADNIITADEIRDLIADGFQKCLANINDYNEDIFNFYAETIRLYNDQTAPGNKLNIVGRGIDLNNEMSLFIQKNALEDFLLTRGIYQVEGTQEFVVSFWLELLFPDPIAFEKILSEQLSSSPVIQEFYHFYKTFKQNSDNPLPYNFQHFSDLIIIELKM